MTDDTLPGDPRYAFVESLSRDEALMFATYVASLAPQAFARAAELVERDRVALGTGLPADVPAVPDPLPAPVPETPGTAPAPVDVPVPRMPVDVPEPEPIADTPPEEPEDVPEPEPIADTPPEEPEDVPEPEPLPVPPPPADVPAVPEPESPPTLVAVPPDLPEPRELYLRAVQEFAPQGVLRRRPSIRALKRVLRCGQPTAQDVREYLTEYAAS
ncbi:hypothetical protein AB0C10_21270 [Microbispora amethystogenes]|uniref:hypothetical protein n=1 Tax=Microbispora amethystogenes TaxID=1427754 RepID=UPI0034067407